MSARLDSLIGNSYSVVQFADLPVPSQLAIVWYLAVDCGAWDAVDLSLYSADHLAACRTFPLAGRIAHRSWNLTV